MDDGRGGPFSQFAPHSLSLFSCLLPAGRSTTVPCIPHASDSRSMAARSLMHRMPMRAMIYASLPFLES